MTYTVYYINVCIHKYELFICSLCNMEKDVTQIHLLGMQGGMTH